MADDSFSHEAEDEFEELASGQEHIQVYLRMRRIFGDGSVRHRDTRRRAKKDPTSSVPYGAGRDPRGLGDVMDSLTSQLGWTSTLAQSDIISAWASIVGQETAEHAEPVGIEDKTLTVRCDSTAWATQLRLMRPQILGKIATEFAEANIESVRFLGPDTPSWKHGPRSIPGRGPRDTYG